MKKYKYIGAIVAVLILVLTFTLMSINDLVVLCKLEPVDANNLLAVQQAILFVIIKTIILSYGTYWISLELYHEVHIKGLRLKYTKERLIRNSETDLHKIVRVVDDIESNQPDISKLNFEPVVNKEYSFLEIRKCMLDKPNKADYSRDDLYQDAYDLWLDNLPVPILENYSIILNWKRNNNGVDFVPDYIQDLVSKGYSID